MKLLVTRELGRLAKWLRILGVDTAYSHEETPSRLIIQSLREERTLVTRNTRLASSDKARVVLLAGERLEGQLAELLKALKLNPNSVMMFSRCTICNVPLSKLPREAAQGRVPEYVLKTQEVFHTCTACGRIYWAGTHWGNVKKALERLAAGSSG